MTSPDLFSVRMRASAGAVHISGAERMVQRDRIEGTVQELVRRAWGRELQPDQVVVTVDSLGTAQVLTLPALDLTAVTTQELPACREIAFSFLADVGVSRIAIEAASSALDSGAGPSGGNMRGAMLVDSDSGERLEPDRSRGIRVSRFDWNDDASVLIDRSLAGLGLTHFRTKEALALATKVAHGPGVVAELCWSDEPEYTAGYVASLASGYIRLPRLKPAGCGRGGRAFFVRDRSAGHRGLIAYLQETPVLLTSIGACRAAEGTSKTGRGEY